jgi:hypothetical protein
MYVLHRAIEVGCPNLDEEVYEVHALPVYSDMI